MPLSDYHTFNITQSTGKNGYQLSATGGTLKTIVVLSGTTSGFLNLHDANNGLPLGALGRTVASGLNLPATTSAIDLSAELNSGLYVEAVGPVNALITWA